MIEMKHSMRISKREKENIKRSINNFKKYIIEIVFEGGKGMHVCNRCMVKLHDIGIIKCEGCDL